MLYNPESFTDWTELDTFETTCIHSSTGWRDIDTSHRHCVKTYTSVHVIFILLLIDIIFAISQPYFVITAMRIVIGKHLLWFLSQPRKFQCYEIVYVVLEFTRQRQPL